ncbi:NAD(P)-binding protein [Agrocybe pediades]|nr:NAD(P)-binding protein [Agrocybe pediades]
MSKELVLVTGATGFIASHTIDELIKRGYRVRGTVRSAKYQNVVDTVKVPGLEFVEINDVATGDFTEALKGVDAVLHIACPLPGRVSREEVFKTAVEGALNVVRQAQEAGIKRFVVTSSFGTLLSPTHMPAFHGLNIDESQWGENNDEEFEEKKDDPYYVYFAAKIKEERALWDFAAQHPDIKVVTIHPGYVIGPYSRTFPLPTAVANMGTNDFIFKMINKGEIPFAPNWIVDVRDVARGHVLALEKLDTLPADDLKRFVINAVLQPWSKAAEHLKKTRPEVADRIIPLEEVKPLPGVLSTLDNTRSKEILGMEYLSVEQTYDEAVTDLLELEKNWKSQN